MNAALFDLDGTLVDLPFAYIERNIRTAMRSFGKNPTDEQVRAMWYSMHRDELIKELGVDPHAYWPRHHEFDTPETRISHVFVYDDVVPVLNGLRAKGFKLGIVTGAPQHMAELEVGRIGIEHVDYFVSASARNGFHPKPHSYGIDHCLETLGVRKEDAFYVGNTEEDVLAARNSGVREIIIDRPNFTYEGPEPARRIASLRELLTSSSRRRTRGLFRTGRVP